MGFLAGCFFKLQHTTSSHRPGRGCKLQNMEALRICNRTIYLRCLGAWILDVHSFSLCLAGGPERRHPQGPPGTSKNKPLASAGPRDILPPRSVLLYFSRGARRGPGKEPEFKIELAPGRPRGLSGGRAHEKSWNVRGRPETKNRRARTRAL